MAYASKGLQAMFPVYLSRMAEKDKPRDEFDISVAQNESNLNQNLETLYQKLTEIEAYLTTLE